MGGYGLADTELGCGRPDVENNSIRAGAGRYGQERGVRGMPGLTRSARAGIASGSLDLHHRVPGIAGSALVDRKTLVFHTPRFFGESAKVLIACVCIRLLTNDAIYAISIFHSSRVLVESSMRHSGE